MHPLLIVKYLAEHWRCNVKVVAHSQITEGWTVSPILGSLDGREQTSRITLDWTVI